MAQGLPLDLADTKGRAPIHWAASQNAWKVVKFMLLEFPGAYTTAKDAEGRTPLEVAEFKKSDKTIKVIFQFFQKIFFFFIFLIYDM